MRRIDFYKKKQKIHEEIIQAICEIMDKQMVEEIDFEDLGMDGGYVCIATAGPAVETRVLKLKHVIGTHALDFVPENTDCCDFDDEMFSLNDDVLNASFDSVYEAVYDLFYNKEFAAKRKRCLERNVHDDTE